MTHTKLNKKALDIIVRTFNSIQDSRKRDLIAEVMISYPENFSEFIENVDKDTYEKIMAKA